MQDKPEEWVIEKSARDTYWAYIWFGVITEKALESDDKFGIHWHALEALAAIALQGGTNGATGDEEQMLENLK